MNPPKPVIVYVIYGQGIGCHSETAHAYEKAGADVRVVLLKQLLSKDVKLRDAQILNFSGGFMHGDILGAGMCAANELEHSGIKEDLLKFVEDGNIIYGQCNGFQLLVRTGLLPGIGRDYSRQTLTLAHNGCGNYRVAPVLHKLARPHFAFAGIENSFYIMCRHGEGKVQFYTEFGSVSREEGEQNRRITNNNHVILRYVHPCTDETTQEFPYNPNGSIDGIAGLVDVTGRIIGHMAHSEVGIYRSRNPDFFKWKEQMRREGVMSDDITPQMLEDTCMRVFKNLVRYFK